MTRLSFALALLALAAGCSSGTVGHNGDVVGGPCSASGGCADGSECLTSSMYPGGTCSVSCTTQDDCPSGSTCVTEGGGRCVLPCSASSDCRDGYGCTERSTPDGHAMVCIL